MSNAYSRTSVPASGDLTGNPLTITAPMRAIQINYANLKWGLTMAAKENAMSLEDEIHSSMNGPKKKLLKEEERNDLNVPVERPCCD